MKLWKKKKKHSVGWPFSIFEGRIRRKDEKLSIVWYVGQSEERKRQSTYTAFRQWEKRWIPQRGHFDSILPRRRIGETLQRKKSPAGSHYPMLVASKKARFSSGGKKWRICKPSCPLTIGELPSINRHLFPHLRETCTTCCTKLLWREKWKESFCLTVQSIPTTFWVPAVFRTSSYRQSQKSGDDRRRCLKSPKKAELRHHWTHGA